MQISTLPAVQPENTLLGHLLEDKNGLSEADFNGRLWSYTDASGQTLAARMQFLPGGRIGGFPMMASQRWSFTDNVLAFRDRLGRTITRFSHDESDGTLLSFRGLSAENRHTQLIALPDAPPIEGIAVHPRFLNPLRRNLVILRAGRDSLHPQWARDIQAYDRNWDLCISHYGTDAEFAALADCEYAVHQNKDRKWPAVSALFGEDSPLWHYDYVMMPDDDIQMSWSDINRCFQLMRDYDLQLAQPALAGDTVKPYYSHDITLSQPNMVLRYTSFVEVMIPIFSREALKICLPSFSASHSGWGLDYAWACMLAYPGNRIAIFDEVPVRHTRPVGTNYTGLTPEADAGRVMAEFGGVNMQINYGVICTHGS